ncbi:tRNA uridine-5-carboxymethylaminomethyl(34) synthesis GTPase MnmE [Mycoplasma marinum]|uniref:tRNA modification GTPase MnmE n=1 Tax=Mycoplasma marinum TaxID=1937190 RepID=A0A4R0XL32_9MOLU|nr:tRNA uridine-5-carboxymethylaminomethyl(34) synthesis GTPase MnmE [Mycoplasma marinum]TCG11353.1 tRNA uridine-5-carboxymethylaminomethyl(34) synthesis GTPase MnmE [Mycoplasma marinum]
MYDTIAAISSGNINQAISIIRVSGPEAFDIVSKIFTGKVGKDKTLTFGNIMDQEQMVDEVLVAWFVGPNTFVGEDTVEINAHGGVVNTNKILELILANGARMAENGEFSRRSFMNGKMDLVKAEAINDLIHAKSESQTQLSVKKFDGKTSKLIDELKNKLLNIIATCEVNIDYPEYDDVEQLTTENLLPALMKIENEIKEIVRVSTSSRVIYEGVSVAIVGKPNAGKSSLLNALLQEEKAIVTDTPGTTRDIVEGSLQVGQVLLKIKDTAGIHKTEDKIEKIGIEKSISEISKSDLVIHLIDSKEGQTKEDEEIELAAKGKPYLKVWNKNDLVQQKGISISAKENELKELYEAIEEEFKNIDLNDERIVYNTRQLSLIKASLISIQDAISGLNMQLGPDTIIIDIQKAWDDLANILGKADQEDLLDSMFKNFCLGK